jgi:hypothetical protein
MLIMSVVVILSAACVWLDARNNNIHKINDDKSITNMSVVEWFWLTLLLWIIGFPLYLINRKKLIAKCKGEIVIKNGIEYRMSQPDAIVKDDVKYTRVEKKRNKSVIVLGIIVLVILIVIILNVRFISKKDLSTMSDYPILYNTAYGPAHTGITLGALLKHPDVKVLRVGSFLYITLDKIQVISNLVKIVTEQGDVEVVMISDDQFARIDMLLAKSLQLKKKSVKKTKMGVIAQARRGANDTSAKSALQTIALALYMYQSSEGIYPENLQILATGKDPYISQEDASGMFYGYKCIYRPSTDRKSYSLEAIPVEEGVTGTKRYVVDTEGRVVER